MDGSNAKRNQELSITVFQEALEQIGHAPKREFATVTEFEAYFQKYETLLVDGTEQREQRPRNKEMQKDYYSGKKMHTVKELVISTTIRWVSFISRYYGGKHHDYSVLKSVLPVDKE